MAQQTEEVVVGSRGSTLLLEPDKTSIIEDVRSALAAAGQPMPLVMGAGANTPGLIFAIGSRLPESLVLSWYEHPGAVPVAQANRARIDPSDWCEAWVLLGNDNPETLTIASIFTTHVANRPMSGYQEVLRSGDFIVMRPSHSTCT